MEQVRAKRTGTAFAPRAGLTAPALAELAALDDAAFRRRFAGTAIKRIGRDRFVRNVAYALGNSGAPTVLPAVQHLLNDNSPLVRDAARWALSRLTGGTHETRTDNPAGVGV
jgi:epoxyqueuosine reductase